VAYDSGIPVPATRRRALISSSHEPVVEATHSCPAPLRESIERARATLASADADAANALALAAEAAAIIGALPESSELSLALIARAALNSADGAARAAPAVLGEEPVRVAQALQRLGTLGLPRDWSPAAGLDTRQTETLRKMLLAVVSDPRLVLARLAEELVGLRHARARPAPERARRALEARAIYAALANRLGAWGLGWDAEG